MPSEPVIVPPPPTINQSDSPEQIAHTLENVQKIFDKVAPKIKTAPTPEPPEPSRPASPPEAAKTVETPAAPVEPPTDKKEPVQETPDTVADHKVPSFIEKALSVDEVKPEQAATSPVDEDWPEELPEFNTPEERKTRYKTWREKYKALKDELKTVKERPSVDPNLQQRLQFLEEKNKEYETTLSRVGVEQHREFQDKILRPMHAAWNEAARIVKEAGGDPNELGKAMALSGKAHFEALDSIFEGMPESAKIEANEAIRNYRRADEARRAALANAPKTAEALRKADMQRQYEILGKQKEEMKSLFESAIQKLRDEAKVEVLQKSNDPDAKWWNEQADQLVETSRKLFLDNTDMSKVAMAVALAPMVDSYRKLWMVERQARAKAEKIIRDRFGGEPNLSESGGANGGAPSLQEDLKKPITEVFLREFHKQRAQGIS